MKREGSPSVGSPSVKKSKTNKRLKLTADSPSQEDLHYLSEIEDDINKGNEKINKDGELHNNRLFKVETYVLPRHPSRRYVLAIDVARSLLFRDSFHFFSRAFSVGRVNASRDDVDFLVEKGVVDSRRRYNTLPICSARSLFKAFVIVNGVPEVDDYWPLNSPNQLTPHESIPEPTRDPDPSSTEKPTKQPFIASISETTKQLNTRCAHSAAEFNSRLRSLRPSSFYDVHTNLEQMPKSSQPTHFYIEKQIVGTKEVGMFDGGVGGTWDGSEVGNWVVVSDSKPGKFPLALKLGQSRDSISIFQKRFKDQTVLPHTTQPIDEETNLTIIEPAIEREPIIHYCGGKCLRNRTCTRVVSKKGERCNWHRGVQIVGLDQKAVCCHCEKAEAPLMSENNTDPDSLDVDVIEDEAADGGVPRSLLVFCYRCKLFQHPRCVELGEKDVVSKIERYEWKCPNCKKCDVCDSDDEANDDKMLFCDSCDRGYHLFCLDPPLVALPEGNWQCFKCYTCISCNKVQSKAQECADVFIPNSEPNEIPVYLGTYCQKCYQTFKHDKYCPICLKIYTEEEVSPMVCCDSCDRWVHVGCDEILNEDILEQEDSRFICILCDKRRLNTKIGLKNSGTDPSIYKKIVLNRKNLVSPSLK